MHLDLSYHEQTVATPGTAAVPKYGQLPGLAALTILLVVGLFSVIPAKASVYPGLGWVTADGTVGAQADSARSDTCNFGAAMAQGLAPVCATTLK